MTFTKQPLRIYFVDQKVLKLSSVTLKFNLKLNITFKRRKQDRCIYIK